MLTYDEKIYQHKIAKDSKEINMNLLDERDCITLEDKEVINSNKICHKNINQNKQ